MWREEVRKDVEATLREWSSHRNMLVDADIKELADLIADCIPTPEIADLRRHGRGR